ncbi:hypothetical protein, partial [Aquidulcibacter paucihalophilus]|uniref:hypothetical protein n=1 Tax=Aquidulcibacter paucihalophilus TaxID=1978549 RepID=UPI0012FF5D66
MSYYEAVDESSNLLFSLQLLAVMLALVFNRNLSNIWEWLFPRITFMFGDAAADAKKRAGIRLTLVTAPITSVILPILGRVDKVSDPEAC